MEGKWLSILEYASYKGKSISTVRRYIKAKRVKFREEEGKYYIWAKDYLPRGIAQEKDTLELRLENDRVKKENVGLKEEIAELKMLIAIYEQKLSGLSGQRATNHA